MRGLIFALSTVVALAGAAQALSQPADPAPAAQRAPRSAQGVGVVTEIDPSEHTVTLKHEPIKALGWPAMTMSFRVEPASLLTGLKVGQKIGFDTTEDGALPQITAIRKK